jgi:hypothetical protein
MKLKFKHLLLIAICCFNSLLVAHANEKLWNDAKQNLAAPKYSAVMPEKFRTLQLDFDGINSLLAKAPIQDGNIFAKSTQQVISLPLPYGGFEHFYVVQTPMMEAELAAKYPEIKTYTAIGMENPSHMAKLDVGPMGFNAMVLSNDGRYFIDPVFVNNNAEYISYFRKDLPTWANTFNCNVIADEQFELENKNRVEAYLARNNAAVVTYRVYRLALACTIEYAKAATALAAPTKAQVLAKMVTSMNRVNGVYETDVAVRMNLVAKNDTLIFISGTDPYTNSNGSTMLSENQSTVNSRIGSANYDIGHVFSTGGGGIASLGSVCVANRKAQGVTGSPSPVGDAFDIDYVAHEMGHQFAGNHTFNSVTSSCGGGNRSSTTAYEPGSGTTIMAYAGICGSDDIAPNSDPYFHAGSLDEINAFISTTANACAAKTVTANNQPIVNAGADYVIPISTPFILKGTASDPDSGDVLSYSWEQMDLGPQGAPNSATLNAPLFRFFPPKNTGSRMFPQLSNVLANSTTLGERLPSYARSMRFRLTARDSKPNAGATGKDEMNITVSASAGPFAITSSNTIDTFLVGSSETITWNVNNTNAAPVNCALVRILLSTDSGQSFSDILVDSTANDGSETILVPNRLTSTARIKIESIGNIFFDINNAAIRILAPVGPSFNLSGFTANASVCPPDSVIFGITASSILGFADSIKLTVSNLPVGASAGLFSKNPIYPNDTAYVKIATLGLTAGAKTFKINGAGVSVNNSATFGFTVLGTVTLSSALTSPSQQQLNVLPNTTFNWGTVTAATGYQLQVAKDTLFTNKVADTIIVGAGTLVCTINGLPQLTKLYCRVAGRNLCGSGPFSEIIGFTTNGVPAAPTNLIKVTSTASSATIRWTDNALNESSFKVERSDSVNTNFLQVASLASGATQYISTNLAAGKTYYYRVKAVNVVGSSNYSNELMIAMPVGIGAETAANILSVYPNPTNNSFVAQFNSPLKGKMEVIVLDELGRVVNYQTINKSSDIIQINVDLSTMNKGVYFLKIQSDQAQYIKRVLKF